MKNVTFIINVIKPTQETGFVKSVSSRGKLTITTDKRKAKHYRNEDAVMYDLDLLANYTIEGYNFYYNFE